MTQSIKDSVNDTESQHENAQQSADKLKNLKVNTEEGSQEEVVEKQIQDINKEITREEMKHKLQDQLIPMEPSASDNMENEKHSAQANKLSILTQQDTLLPESQKVNAQTIKQEVINEPVKDVEMKVETTEPLPDLSMITQIISG